MYSPASSLAGTHRGRIRAPDLRGLDRSRLRDLLDTLDSQAFAGNPRLRYPLPPSTSPKSPAHPRSYWRGPVWPVANWLLWWSLLRAGESERAKRIRRETLEELSEGGFAEYFEPYTGEALGSGEQSWTAAVALDMLATGGRGLTRDSARRKIIDRVRHADTPAPLPWSR